VSVSAREPRRREIDERLKNLERAGGLQTDNANFLAVKTLQVCEPYERESEDWPTMPRADGPANWVHGVIADSPEEGTEEGRRGIRSRGFGPEVLLLAL